MGSEIFRTDSCSSKNEWKPTVILGPQIKEQILWFFYDLFNSENILWIKSITNKYNEYKLDGPKLCRNTLHFKQNKNLLLFFVDFIYNIFSEVNLKNHQIHYISFLSNFCTSFVLRFYSFISHLNKVILHWSSKSLFSTPICLFLHRFSRNLLEI